MSDNAEVRLCRNGLHPMVPGNIGTNNKCAACSRAKAARWRENNKDYFREDTKRRRDANRKLVFDHYGTKCSCCGSTNDLTLDHIVPVWDTARRMGQMSQSTIKWAAVSFTVHGLWPDGLQTHCGLCNRAKGTGPACTIHNLVADLGPRDAVICCRGLSDLLASEAA